MDFADLIAQIVARSEAFLQSHAVNGQRYGAEPLSGEFALQRGQGQYDLYGCIDAVYILYTIGKLDQRTNQDSRRVWAGKILACQDEQGWFSKRNLRGHSREHATAYAIGALRLLELEPGEVYVGQLKPLTALLSILTDQGAFHKWIKRLGLRYSLESILKKNLGWQHVWRGSHVGGGVAAVVGMSAHLFEVWWPGRVDAQKWFDGYFAWLDAQVNPQTGYWQRAVWNRIYKKLTIIDMGGAVHFFWIYWALARPWLYPAQVIEATLALQKPSGLYKNHPFCIDLDGNFCLTRSFLQLAQTEQKSYRPRVYQSIQANFEAIVSFLTGQPFENTYSDSHGLPGALAALLEGCKLPDWLYAAYVDEWQHPLDKVWWL